jgi:hypothetical protein
VEAHWWSPPEGCKVPLGGITIVRKFSDSGIGISVDADVEYTIDNGR